MSADSASPRPAGKGGSPSLLHRAQTAHCIRALSPRRYSTPKIIRSEGMATAVTTVTSTPAPRTVSPWRRGCRESLKQNPDSSMNPQQMPCCQT